MSEPRIIKRYTNRKLYDTRDSRYVTLSQIATMVRTGEDITVVDNASGDDLTSLTLAQIIYEQEKKEREVLPLSALRELVRRGEARIADIREGLRTRPEGEEEPLPETEAESKRSFILTSKELFEDLQRRVDEQLHTILDTLAPFRQLQDDMKRVAERLEEVEGRLLKLAPKRRAVGGAASPPSEGAGAPSTEARE